MSDKEGWIVAGFAAQNRQNVHLQDQVDRLRRALAVAKCLYQNDRLTDLGEHLEKATKEATE